MQDKNSWGCSSVGRAPQWHCGGRRFEPDHLHFLQPLPGGVMVAQVILVHLVGVRIPTGERRADK